MTTANELRDATEKAIRRQKTWEKKERREARQKLVANEIQKAPERIQEIETKMKKRAGYGDHSLIVPGISLDSKTPQEQCYNRLRPGQRLVYDHFKLQGFQLRFIPTPCDDLTCEGEHDLVLIASW